MTKMSRIIVLIYFKKEKKTTKNIILLPINKSDLTEMEIYIITYDMQQS